MSPPPRLWNRIKNLKGQAISPAPNTLMRIAHLMPHSLDAQNFLARHPGPAILGPSGDQPFNDVYRA